MSNKAIKSNNSYKAEPIEAKVRRLMNNKEPIGDANTPLIYTERKGGVSAAHNIRTDKWELAAEAADKVTQSVWSKKDKEDNPEKYKPKEGDGGTEPVQATK